MKRIKRKLVDLLFICLISGSVFTDVYAKTMRCEDIPLNGSWNEKERSVPPDIPIIAFMENRQLVIKSFSLRSDITIQVIGSLSLAYEETVFAEKTGYILIDLDKMKNGVYTLSLTNQWGDLLYGEFMLE